MLETVDRVDAMDKLSLLEIPERRFFLYSDSAVSPGQGRASAVSREMESPDASELRIDDVRGGNDGTFGRAMFMP